MGRQFHAPVESEAPPSDSSPSAFASIMAKLSPAWMTSGPKPSVEMPSMLDVVTTSLNIMQVRITRSRLAGEPADIMIRPRLSDIASLDFHRAAPAITEGQRAAEQKLPEVREFFGA
jgi:NTE family protein